MPVQVPELLLLYFLGLSIAILLVHLILIFCKLLLGPIVSQLTVLGVQGCQLRAILDLDWILLLLEELLDIHLKLGDEVFVELDHVPEHLVGKLLVEVNRYSLLYYIADWKLPALD